MEAEGGFPRRLADSEAMDGASAWSRDGQWVYFFSDRTGTYEVWKVEAAGGEAQQVTQRGGVLPAESGRANATAAAMWPSPDTGNGQNHRAAFSSGTFWRIDSAHSVLTLAPR